LITAKNRQNPRQTFITKGNSQQQHKVKGHYRPYKLYL